MIAILWILLSDTMDKEQMAALVASKTPHVVIDQSIPQEMREEFSRLRTIPYLTKDFEGNESSSDTSSEATVNETECKKPKAMKLYTVNDFVYRATPENLSALTAAFEAHLVRMLDLTKEQRRKANSGYVRWRETDSTGKVVEASDIDEGLS